MKLRTLEARRGRRSTKRGTSLLEVVVAITFLVIGLLSLTSTSLAAHVLHRVDAERQLAQQSLTQAVSELRAFAVAQRESGGWALAMTTQYAPGHTFDIEGLDPWTGEASCGSITLITDENTRDADLGLPLGLPRDLNNDGSDVDFDVSGSARLLPAIVRVRWEGLNGQQEIEQGLYLSEF